MRTEAEVREYLEMAERMRDEPGRAKTGVVIIHAKVQALQWVLGEEETDLAL